MIGAVIFDLDGTLVDSGPDMRVALNRVLAEEGRRQLSLDEVKPLVGEGTRVMVNRALLATGEQVGQTKLDEILARFMNYYSAKPAALAKVYPGADRQLRALKAKGIKLGLCTNKPEAVTWLVLDALGLKGVFDGVAGGDVPRRKPDGEHLRETLRRMGAERLPAIFVGDSGIDVAAAKGADLPVICYASGYSTPEAETLGADRVMRHYDELPGLLADLQARVAVA